MKNFLLLTIGGFALLGTWTVRAEPVPRDLPRLGMNINGNAYWERHYFFNNGMLQASKWLNSTPADLARDAHGWPTEVPSQNQVGLPIFLNNRRNWPEGDWTLRWEGTGDIVLQPYSSNTVAPSLIESGPNRKVYRVTKTPTADGFKLMWISTAPAPDHVRNVQIWMPGQDLATQVMHQVVLNDVKPFGVLRFMHFTGTNGNPQVTWSDRVQPLSPTQQPVAWEYVIAFANEAGKDAWICVPHQADDNYVRQLGQLFAARLDSQLRVWVEYSNEVGNNGSGFSQTARIQK